MVLIDTATEYYGISLFTPDPWEVMAGWLTKLRKTPPKTNNTKILKIDKRLLPVTRATHPNMMGPNVAANFPKVL